MEHDGRRPAVEISLLNKLWSNLHRDSNREYITSLARDLHVSTYQLKKELKYLTAKGVVKSSKRGVERLYELTPRGEKLIWYFNNCIREPVDELFGMIDDSKVYEKEFDTQLNVTHKVLYSKVLVDTRVSNLPIPQIGLVGNIRYAGGI